jgi:hypothetical protein
MGNMMLDISGADRNVLYNLQRRLAYMTGQVNNMTDQYPTTSEEEEAMARIGLSLSQVLVALDDVLMPE